MVRGWRRGSSCPARGRSTALQALQAQQAAATVALPWIHEGNTVDSTGSTNAGSSSRSQNIRIGIGGWTFEPWRDNFYPAGLAHSKELQYASRQLPSIEVNGTYYSTFKPPTFAKWRDETPEGFLFSLKANRFATHRRVLAEAGESITLCGERDLAAHKHTRGPLVAVHADQGV